MRWYSAGEHLFCMTSSVRRAIVSQDAMIRSVIIIGSGTVLRRLRAVMDNPFPMTRTVQRFQISDVPWVGCCLSSRSNRTGAPTPAARAIA
jgi:hypothetical protein